MCGAAGTFFIFLSIIKFSSLFVGIVTTTRKVFSILLSVIINNHSFGTNRKLGFVLVMLGIIINLRGSYLHSKKESAELAKKLKKEK